MYKWITNNAEKNPNWMDSYDPEGKYEADHEIELSERLNFVKTKNHSYGKSFYSVEDSGKDLLEAYANLMNTIVKGHENGTRKSFVKDNGELREMTLQEELDALDAAFVKLSERSAERLRKREDEAKVLEDYDKQLSEIKGNKAAKLFMEQFKSNRG